MKLWRVNYYTPDSGKFLEWLPSKRAASKRVAELKKEEREGPQWRPGEINEGYGETPQLAEMEPVTVPTTRPELIDWLNKHCRKDNG